MALYTFESERSYLNLKDGAVVADSSYLYCLSDKSDPRYGLVLDFHQRTKKINSEFFINVVVRQEFLKQVRKVQMIETMLYVARKYRHIKAAYIIDANFAHQHPDKRHLQIHDNQIRPDHLQDCYDALFKEHLRRGDVDTLTKSWQGNVSDYVTEQEKNMDLIYYSAQGSMSWDALYRLMQVSGMASTDAMICNFALTIGANAIVTADLDYIQMAKTIDVFMPHDLAVKAPHIYDPGLD